MKVSLIKCTKVVKTQEIQSFQLIEVRKMFFFKGLKLAWEVPSICAEMEHRKTHSYCPGQSLHALRLQIHNFLLSSEEPSWSTVSVGSFLRHLKL